MTARKFEGVFAVTVTPFGPEGEFDRAASARILEWHIAQGAAGLAIAADNGEASALSLVERQALAETAVRVAAGRVPVVMGAMGTHAFSAAETAKMVEVAAAAGVDAVLIGPAPYLGQASRAEIVRRFRDIHRAVPMPMIAYNNPRHFGVAIDGETLANLADEVELVGVKQSSRDFYEVSTALARFGHRIAFFMGCGWLIMPGLAAGAAGVLSTGADLFGKESAGLVATARAAWTAETRRLHLRIARAYRFLLETGTAPAALKALLNALGLPAGQPRLPLLPLGREDLARLHALFSELGVLPAPAMARAGG